MLSITAIGNYVGHKYSPNPLRSSRPIKDSDLPVKARVTALPLVFILRFFLFFLARNLFTNPKRPRWEETSQSKIAKERIRKRPNKRESEGVRRRLKRGMGIPGGCAAEFLWVNRWWRKTDGAQGSDPISKAFEIRCVCCAARDTYLYLADYIKSWTAGKSTMTVGAQERK